MRKIGSFHIIAILQALFVTFLWSTSWVLIKNGLENIPVLTFAGLRYALAFLFLLPWLLRGSVRAEISRLNRRDWALLIVLGLVYYSLTQGSVFLALELLPANTLSLMLSLSGASIALAGWVFLEERLSGLQLAGVAISMLGALLYFDSDEGLAGFGLLVGVFAVVANTAGAILGRAANRGGQISPLVVTGVSMGVGAALLLAGGLLTEPFPLLRPSDAMILVWLAAVNTSLAFTLWNLALRTLSAAQASVINNTMLIQIAVLAWFFLGERPGSGQLLGMLVTAVGAALVQMRSQWLRWRVAS